jgi:hypothetical protein
MIADPRFFTVSAYSLRVHSEAVERHGGRERRKQAHSARVGKPSSPGLCQA